MRFKILAYVLERYRQRLRYLHTFGCMLCFLCCVLNISFSLCSAIINHVMKAYLLYGNYWEGKKVYGQERSCRIVHMMVDWVIFYFYVFEFFSSSPLCVFQVQSSSAKMGRPQRKVRHKGGTSIVLHTCTKRKSKHKNPKHLGQEILKQNCIAGNRVGKPSCSK